MAEPTLAESRREAAQAAVAESAAPATAEDRFVAWRKGEIGRNVRRLVGMAVPGVIVEPDWGSSATDAEVGRHAKVTPRTAVPSGASFRSAQYPAPDRRTAAEIVRALFDDDGAFKLARDAYERLTPTEAERMLRSSAQTASDRELTAQEEVSGHASEPSRRLAARDLGAEARARYGADRPSGPTPVSEDDFAVWGWRMDAARQRALNEAAPNDALDWARHERDSARIPSRDIDGAAQRARTPPVGPVPQRPVGTLSQITAGALALGPSVAAVEEILKSQTVGGKFETIATLLNRPVRLDDLDKGSSALADLRADPVAREFLYADGLIDDDVYQAALQEGR